MTKLCLTRNPSQYAQCSPKAISEGSPAQMMFFVEDAKKDIAALAREIDRITEERDRIERNRDMWRGQVERQSAKISQMREVLRQFSGVADFMDSETDGFQPSDKLSLVFKNEDGVEVAHIQDWELRLFYLARSAVNGGSDA